MSELRETQQRLGVVMIKVVRSSMFMHVHRDQFHVSAPACALLLALTPLNAETPGIWVIDRSFFELQNEARQ